MVRNFSMQSLIHSLLFICTILLSNNALALTKVTASVDKNPAMLNESILLTVTADDDISRNALDTRALLTDFIVGQTSVSSQTSMVNFNTTRLTKWQVILIARRAGNFTIPALTINNINSDPINLTVEEQSKTDNTKQADIFVTSALSTDEVYVQQSLTLTMKLHFSVELKSGSITEPSLTGASIEKAGKDKQTDSIINGKRYRVIEQTYAVTPEQSGDFTLQAPVFSGEILQAATRRSSFLSFSNAKAVSVVGEALQLSVLPIPNNYPTSAQWLPTEILTLHQEWQSGGNEFTVGEPITRTITLTAAGLSKAQLPKIDMKSSRGLKIYPDQAELNSNINGGKLVSQKVQNFALVPSAPGEFVLPEMAITWFNTVTNKVSKATLPAQTITVKAAEDGYTNLPTDENNQTVQNAGTIKGTENQEVSQIASGQITNEKVINVQASTDKTLQWLFLGLWLITSLSWFIHVMFLRKKDAKPRKISTTPINNNHYSALLTACKNNNAELALSLVLPWLKVVVSSSHPTLEIGSISQGQTVINDQNFTFSVTELQEHLYGKDAVAEASAWEGTVLSNAVKAVNSQQTSQSNSGHPIQLNP